MLIIKRCLCVILFILLGKSNFYTAIALMGFYTLQRTRAFNFLTFKLNNGFIESIYRWNKLKIQEKE